MVEAHDYGQIIIIVAMLMEQLTKSIETAAKSDTAFGDNHDLLRAIQRDAEAILSLKFEGTRHFRSSKTICYDKF
jgi:predicted component of type VI protein secretion system